MPISLVTIGAYGHDEEGFFQALVQAGVDTFCDIRWRRGVRGREYAFVNSQRLQDRLAELGIRYLHRRDLAPPPDMRSQQHQADKAAKIAKRSRDQLSPQFVQAYQAQILSDFDPATLVRDLGDARIVALFCVEGPPQACHRSILADRLQRELGIPVAHVLPPNATTTD